MQLHETAFGVRFFNNQMPNLIKELGRIADALEKQNEIHANAVNSANNENIKKEKSDYESHD